MKPGRQALRLRPPHKQEAADDALARLEKLENWTEEPAKAIAEVLNDGQAASAAEHAAAEVPHAPAKGRRVRGGGKPWLIDSEPTQAAVKPFQVRLPGELFQQLKWLGETTYGSSMNGICVDAIQREVNRLMREREKVQPS